MSTNGLIGRIASEDAKKENETLFQYVWVQHQQILKIKTIICCEHAAL